MGALMDVPMPLSQLVYLSVLSAAVCSVPEGISEGIPHNLRMDSHNFRHVLSWQGKRDPAAPASYSVLYRDRRKQHWVRAEQCSGIAQLSCELTQEFKDTSTIYAVLVQSTAGAQVLNSSVLYFEPFTQTILGPPEVNITSCPNCINVTTKLPTPHFRGKGKVQSLIDIYGELYYDITLKSLDGEHKRPRQKTTEEVFSTVIEELYPSRNYCVSVVVTASLNKHSIPSPWKCAAADSEPRQGYHEAAVAGALCVALIIAAVVKCVHAAGFILPRISLPHTLACIQKLAYSPWWVSESEEVTSVEVVPREVKSKARACRGSVSDDSDSSDGSALCDRDYARRGAPGRGSVPQGCGSVPQGCGSVPQGCGSVPQGWGSVPQGWGSVPQGWGSVPQGWGGPGAAPRYSAGSGAERSGGQAGDEPPAGPQQRPEHPEGRGDGSSGLPSPFSEGGCNSRGSGECFTINLGTVLLGSLEQDGHGAAAAPPAREDAADWECAHALEAKLLEGTGSVQGAPYSNDFREWQNSSSSEGSDASDSDTELVTGYMRR